MRDGIQGLIPYNLNYPVKIKILSRGKLIYEDFYHSLQLKPAELKIDKEGFCEMQLWEVCRIWGNKMDMGFTPPIETTIFLDTGAINGK